MDELEKEVMEWEQEEEKRLDRPRFFAGESRFPRFSRCEIQIGKPYHSSVSIIPSSDAQLEWYRPFEHEPRILRDYLEVMIQIKRNRKSSKRMVNMDSGIWLDAAYQEEVSAISPLIIGFCEKYGFLNRPSEESLKEIYETERAFLKEPWKISQILGNDREAFSKNFNVELNAIHGSFNEWVPKYFQGLRILNTLPRRNYRKGQQSRERKYQRAIQFYLKRQSRGPRGDDISVWYGEEILEYFSQWNSFKNGGFQPNASFNGSIPTAGSKRWIDVLKDFAVTTTMGVEFSNGQWRLDYRINNLLGALKIMVLNSIVGARQQIKLCALQECGRAFITSDPRANYCCPRHSQRGRIRKYREKQKQAASAQRGNTEGKRSPKARKSGVKSRRVQ